MKAYFWDTPDHGNHFGCPPPADWPDEPIIYWQESVRDGPWEVQFAQLPNASNLRPIWFHNRLCWEIIFRFTRASDPITRRYHWDWEGDGTMALREAMLAAQMGFQQLLAV